MARRFLRLALAALIAAGLPFAGTAASNAGAQRGSGPGSTPAFLAGIPKSPAGAAVALVDTIVGDNEQEADAATTELLRLAGIPLVRAEGDLVAIPNDVTHLDAAFYAELVPLLRETVTSGITLSPDQFAIYLEEVGAMPGLVPGDELIAGLGTFGKDVDLIPEAKVTGAAIRALSASRGEVLYYEANPDAVHLDLLQLILVLAVLSQSGGNVASADPNWEEELAATGSGPTLASLLGIRDVAAAPAQTPCEKLQNAMKDNPNLAWKGAKMGAQKSADNLIDQWKKSNPKGRAQQVYTKAKDIQGKWKAAWSKGGDIFNVLILLLGAKLEVNGNPEFLHVRTEGSVSQVAVEATATFESDIAKAKLPCYALAGLNIPPNGPLSGFRIRWSITQPVTGNGLGQGQFLRVATGYGHAFQATGGGGVVTGGDGKSKVLLDVAAERQPRKGKLQKAKVTVRASLDQDDFPFKMSDAWSFWNPGWAKGKIWELVLSAAKRAGLPSQPVVITVEYHDSEAYSIKGTRRIFAFYYLMKIELDLYTCEGLDSEWHGTIKFHGDRNFFGEYSNLVFGNKERFKPTVDQSWTTQFTPNLNGNFSTVVNLVGPMDGLMEIDNGWRTLQRTNGSVIGTMTLLGEGGAPLSALAFLDGFDMSYPIKVGAPSHCPPGGLYFP